MPVENFITLCKSEIAKLISSSEEYDIYVVWKDYWTIGSNQDGTKDLNNQRAIFGTTINDNYYDITYSGNENKLYIDTHSKTASTTVDLNTSQGGNQ